MRWDILVVMVAYLLITFIIGIYASKYLQNRKESFAESYFVGGRSLGPIVLAFTTLASVASASTFLGVPGMAYQVGFSWVLAVLPQVGIGIYILGMLGKKFAIVARKINAVTLTDFLKERYGSSALVLGSSLGILIFITAYMVAQFVGGAIILESITGLPYKLGLIIFGTVVVLYTAIGGFRAVALTDAIQGIVMLLGGVLLWIFFMIKTDGFTGLISELAINHPEMVEFQGASNMSPLMLFSFFVLFGLASIGLPHAAVRGMTYKDSKTLHKTLIYSGIIMALFTFAFATFGPIVRVLYPDIEVADMVMPTLILDIMPGWIAGIVLAAPLAAIMSTVDSMLLVTSGAVVKDIYLNYINPSASREKVSKLSYIATLAVGIVVVLFALSPPDLIQTIVIYAAAGLESTFFATIVFGLYWKRANKWGANLSMFVGLFGYIIIETWYPSPFGMHSIVTSLVLSIVTMIVVSLLTNRPSQDIIQKFWGAGKSQGSKTLELQ